MRGPLTTPSRILPLSCVSAEPKEKGKKKGRLDKEEKINFAHAKANPHTHPYALNQRRRQQSTTRNPTHPLPGSDEMIDELQGAT